jgi:hypothetical protein
MRKTLVFLSFAAGLGLVYSQSAGAVPADSTSVKEAATAASSLQRAEYTERRTRHGVVKCFRALVIGPYRCHYYRDPL